MIPTERFQAATDDTVTPSLFWSELAVCAGGAALACPQCATAKPAPGHGLLRHPNRGPLHADRRR